MSEATINPEVGEKPCVSPAGRWAYILFFPAAVFYLELILRAFTVDRFFDRGLWYILLFSVAIGLAMAFIATLGGRRWNRVSGITVVVLAFLLAGTQLVYHNIFKEYLTLFSLTNAGEVLGEFWKDALLGIWHTMLPLLALVVPVVALIVFGPRFTPQKRARAGTAVCLLVLAVFFYLFANRLILSSTAGIMSDRFVYAETFAPKLAVPRFGVFTTTRLDVRNTMKQTDAAPPVETVPKTVPAEPDTPAVGETSPDTAPEPETAPTSEPEIEEPSYTPNVLEIDFDALIKGETDPVIADMHRYFRAQEPSMKNKYTGVFEGYDLIWIVGEAFSTFALDETHTPTLTRLANEGFVFKNFYNPIWGVSTSDGEYVATTGLIPKNGVWSYYRSSFNYMPFGFGNLFRPLGYSARAYHNHTYTYYDRDLSYPNMGYDYKGLGSGLEVEETWPESDVEMMEKTVPEYVGDPNFLVYYLSVSGHLNYNFFGNAMSAKHREEVADLPYSEAPRAYVACQMEFDQAIGLLLDELEKSGRLDHTVIVISGDHYPYGLEIEEMEELHGSGFDDRFGIYKSTLIIWNSLMERTEVDKLCSSLDIMPTLANLFGLDFDSRLIMGRDILSDTPGLVMFNDRSFITDQGVYDSLSDTFTAAEGSDAGNEYAVKTLGEVNDRFKYSEAILDNDYYACVLKRKTKEIQ